MILEIEDQLVKQRGQACRALSRQAASAPGGKQAQLKCGKRSI
ncbi:MAG: hypothetical protein ABSB41_06475 [Anaerolineales bacterium]|jgi:hypothetical protein